jgi:hypothetical protein
MAVKFSEFTAETVAANITDIVGYQTAGNLNIKIPPANLDTLVSTATAQAGATVTYTLTGTKTGTANTTDVTTFTASGGVTVTAGTNVIDISSLTYTLPITGSAASVTATLTDSNAGVDPVLITGGTNVAFSSITTGGFTIDATDTNTTYDFAAAADGANVDLILTGSEPTTDTVKVTPGTNVNFSSVTAAGFTINSPDTVSTYTLPISGDATAVTATLTGSGGDTDPVLITAGNDIDFSSVTAAGFTIDSSASGDTYELNAGAKVGSSVPLNLDANAGADTFVNLTQGTGITITQDSATEITISSTDTVTSVDEKTPGTSTGIPIIVDPTTGAVEVQSMAYAGQGNVGHVPSGGVAGQYLDGDIGAWTTLPSTLSIDKQTFTGDNTTTDFTLATAAGCTDDNLNIYISGVYQNSVDAANAVNYTVGAGLNPTLQFVSSGVATAPPVTATRGIEVVITR